MFLNVKIKMSQLVIAFETITIECLAEHQQCLGNCRKPKIYKIGQSCEQRAEFNTQGCIHVS